MADVFKTLAQLVILNDQRNAPIDVSDVLNASPVLRVLPANVAKETTYYYTRYTAAPASGFRAAYAGRFNTTSTDEQITVALKILDATVAVDKAVAMAYAGGEGAFVAKEAMRSLQQAFFTAERQFFYGTVTPGASGGFAGLANQTDLNGATDAMVVNAGGTTNSIASSVWLIRATPDDAAMIIGQGGNIDIGATSEVPMAGSDEGTYTALYTPILGWLGMQRGSTYSVARIANITTDSGKGLTDDLIADALSLFPASAQPTHIVMNRRSMKQLQQSRTATSPTGAPAPFPAEAFNVPIVLTDSIVSTEALLQAGS